MSWCCASLQHLSGSDDESGEETHEVVVEKLAIKSIPLLPQDRYSHSPEWANLKCWYPWHSSQTCKSTQTSFEMHHFQSLMVQNDISKSSSVSSFTKLDDNTESTAYLPYHQDKEITGCKMLFTRASSHTEHQMPEDTSNSYCRKSICAYPDNESFIYKPFSDDSSKRACTSINNTKHILSSNLFPSSEELLYTEELACRTNSVIEEQNLTPNKSVRSKNVTSKFSNKQKLPDTQFVPLRQRIPQSIHKCRDEHNNSTDEVCVTFSKGSDPASTQAPCSQIRRNKATSTSNANILQQSDSNVDVKAENQAREIKSFASTKFLETKSATEVSLQQETDDKGLNEEKPLEQKLMVESKRDIKEEIEKNMEPLSNTETRPIQSEEHFKHADKDTEIAVTTWSHVNDRHPTYIHANFYNTPQIEEEQLPPFTIEPMPTFIQFSTKCNIQTKKAFTPQQLSIFLVTFIDNLLKKSSHSAKPSMFSEKTRSLQTKRIATPQSKQKNKSTVIWQIQQNSKCSNIKRKPDKQQQHFSNLNYSDGSYGVEKDHVIRENQETNPSIMKKTFGDHCSNETKAIKNEKLNDKENLKKNECSPRIICSPREQRTNSQTTPEDDNYTSTSTASSTDKICHFPEKRFVQPADSPSHELSISKEAIQSRTKHSKYAASGKGSKIVPDHQSLAERYNEPSTSVDDLIFKEEHTKTTEYSNLSCTHSFDTFHTPTAKFVQMPQCSKCVQRQSLHKQAIESRSTNPKYAKSREGPDLLDNGSLSHSEQSTSADEFFFQECINTITFERSTKMNAVSDLEILAKECSSVYLGDIETDRQNILHTTERCKVPIQKRLYCNTKEIHGEHNKLKDVSPSNTAYYNIQKKLEKFRLHEASPQVKNPKDVKLIKNRISRNVHKDDNKIQSDSNKTSSCISKSDTYLSDQPLSGSSYDDHSGIAGPHMPKSNLSQISQVVNQEPQKETMLWTITIKNVDPEELYQ